MARLLLFMISVAVLLHTRTGMTAEYPTRPVRLIVGFPAGGAADILARIVSQKLSENLQQQIIVDNRPGAGSALGGEIAANASADGYTLLAISSSHVINAALYSHLSYHPIDSFAPISQIASAPQVLLTNRSLPVKSVSELIALAKAKPRQLTFASSGNGSTTHLAAEYFSNVAGVKLVHVPYKGGAPALTDVIAGRVDLMFLSLPPALAQIRAGKINAIAVTSLSRSPALPEVPTVAESGRAGFEVNNWYGILAPTGTPKAVITKLAHELARVIRTPAVVASFRAQGAEPESTSPEQFRRYMASEMSKWGKVIRDSGIRAN